MTSIAVAPLLVDLGRGLREAFFMFWETLWALVLGFTLSGVVQAFVSKKQMQSSLGDHRPPAVAKATFFGMVSSSCSYAASAMAKSLVAKGADFTTAMVFMVSSTNLVVELGLVMLVLLGWQFAVAEFVGGPIMIILLALLGGAVFTPRLVGAARARLTAGSSDAHGHGHDEIDEAPSLRSIGAWSDAAGYAVADATMLRTELLIGYLIAGLLAVLVPIHVWNIVFLHGHGIWTSIENALVGPLIAVLSWVCSIGNVPLAAALWAGGIGFGGVIAFIFADLIAMPLILIYAKFYGWRLTLRLVGLFYVVMVIAGLATELIFGAAGAIPTNRSVAIPQSHFAWNMTTSLNLAALVLATAVWWLAKNRQRFGGGHGYALDPVCGMQVRTADAPASTRHEGITFYFCSDKCKERFEAEPARFATPSAEAQTHIQVREHADESPWHHSDDAPHHLVAIDPICSMEVDPATAAAHRFYDGVYYWFCSTGCAETFDRSPTEAISSPR